MTPATIRLATPDDIEAIARISVRGWQAAYRGIVPDAVLDRLSVDRRTDGWRQFLARSAGSGERLWVADTSGDVVGFVANGPGRDESAAPLDGAGEVYAIYVDPSALRRGHGRRLFGHAVADLAERGFDPIVVWVFDANLSARRFYEALAFRADGSRSTIDFGGVTIDEVRYRLDTDPPG